MPVARRCRKSSFRWTTTATSRWKRSTCLPARKSLPVAVLALVQSGSSSSKKTSNRDSGDDDGEFASYKNKRVVISGCFSGMGEATAKLLLKQGAEVHGLDYKPSKLSLASFTQVDLREPTAIDAAVKKIGGKVDALFNCAGLPQTSPPLDVMKVNYAGTRRLTEQVLPLMSAGGAIVSISSNGGLGWSRRLPVLMGLLKIDNYDGIVKWCQDNAETVREGYAFLEGSAHRLDDDDLHSSDQARHSHQLHDARPDADADDVAVRTGDRGLGAEAAAAHQSALDAGRAGGAVGVSQQ